MCIARRVEIMEQMKSEQGAGKIIPAFIDVTVAQAKDWDAVIKNFVVEYGKISGGVYTAGITGLTPFRRWNEELAQKIMNTSYWGMLRFVQSATKKRFSNFGASFVVFSSNAAYNATQGMLIYSSAKMAVQVAVKTIVKEISQDGYRINSISPGWVKTEMTDSYSEEFGVHEQIKNSFRLGEGTADKISGMVLFLLSSRADWITGQDIVIDGGQLLGGI